MKRLEAPALLLAAALLAAPACSAVGHGTQRSVEAAGVAATSAVASPVIGFLSWPAWYWLGDEAAGWLTGTEEVRQPIPTEPNVNPPFMPTAVNGAQLVPFTRNTMDIQFIIILALCAAVWWLDKRLDRLEP